jgi:hypothetical protein
MLRTNTDKQTSTHKKPWGIKRDRWHNLMDLNVRTDGLHRPCKNKKMLQTNTDTETLGNTSEGIEISIRFNTSEGEISSDLFNVKNKRDHGTIQEKLMPYY